ncbi:MAG: hypothetical protein ACFFB0_11295 [Promethearchaeota archaeon]
MKINSTNLIGLLIILILGVLVGIPTFKVDNSFKSFNKINPKLSEPNELFSLAFSDGSEVDLKLWARKTRPLPVEECLVDITQISPTQYRYNFEDMPDNPDDFNDVVVILSIISNNSNSPQIKIEIQSSSTARDDDLLLTFNTTFGIDIIYTDTLTGKGYLKVSTQPWLIYQEVEEKVGNNILISLKKSNPGFSLAFSDGSEVDLKLWARKTRPLPVEECLVDITQISPTQYRYNFEDMPDNPDDFNDVVVILSIISNNSNSPQIKIEIQSSSTARDDDLLLNFSTIYDVNVEYVDSFSGIGNFKIENESWLIYQEVEEKVGNNILVSLQKPEMVPNITINTPYKYEIFGINAPKYNISIAGLYDTLWYTIDEGITNLTINLLTGTIDQTEWEKLMDGIVNITFYANNSEGFTANAKVMVIKHVMAKEPPAIPGYNLIIFIGILSLITFLIIKKKTT